MNEVIQLKKITKSFNEGPLQETVLEGVDFALLPGEKVSICGASGSGKTTLVNIIGLLEWPTSGKVYWQGQDKTESLCKDLAHERASFLGYVFQSCHLMTELNVIENILMTPRLAKNNISKKDQEWAKFLLEAVGLSGKEKRSISTLSGGERQRVAIVRAMMNFPKVIIADEPTGSLDERSADQITDLLLDLCERYHMGMILITHNAFLAKKTEKCYRMRDKKIFLEERL